MFFAFLIYLDGDASNILLLVPPYFILAFLMYGIWNLKLGKEKKDLLKNFEALEKLGKLKEKELITEEEFNEQKKKLLNQ